MFWVGLATIRVRPSQDPDAVMVGEMQKGDFCVVLETQGDWVRVQNVWTGTPAWVMHQNNKGKKIAEPVAKGKEAIALKVWTKVMEVLVAGGKDPEKEKAAKAAEAAFKAKVEADAAAKKKEKQDAKGGEAVKALGMEKFVMSVQKPEPGGTFWL